MKRQKAPQNDGISDAIRALRKRPGAPTKSDQPKPSTLPGRKVKPLPGQLDLGGNEEPQ